MPEIFDEQIQCEMALAELLTTKVIEGDAQQMALDALGNAAEMKEADYREAIDHIESSSPGIPSWEIKRVLEIHWLLVKQKWDDFEKWLEQQIIEEEGLYAETGGEIPGSGDESPGILCPAQQMQVQGTDPGSISGVLRRA